MGAGLHYRTNSKTAQPLKSQVVVWPAVGKLLRKSLHASLALYDCGRAFVEDRHTKYCKTITAVMFEVRRIYENHIVWMDHEKDST